MVSMTYHNLRALFAITVLYIQGMITKGWINGDYEMQKPVIPKENCNTRIYNIFFKSDFTPIGQTGGYSAAIEYAGEKAELVIWANKAGPFIKVWGKSWFEIPISGKKGSVMASENIYKGEKQLKFEGFSK